MVGVGELPDEIRSRAAGVTLRALTADDAGDYWALLQANRRHLTRHGDVTAEVAASRDTVRRGLVVLSGEERAYGVRLHGTLVGHVTLVAADPPRYGHRLGFRVVGDLDTYTRYHRRLAP